MWPSTVASLKECRAPLTLRLPYRRVGVPDREQQCAGKLLDGQGISARGDHQLAELLELADLELSCLVVERFQLGIIVAGLAHRSVLSC
jgi:hypothetical protein